MAKPHRARIPGTDWQVWRWALLRSAGFTADGLDRFSSAECAALADTLLAGTESSPTAEMTFTEALDRAVWDTAKAIHDVAADPRFRMAVTWQNPGAMVAVDGVLRDGPAAPRNAKRRGREEIVAKYWQRYCAKNDTIGFFGPMCWVRLDPDPDSPPVTGAPGPELTTQHSVFFERWALAAFTEGLAADHDIRPYLPVGLEPQLTLVDGGVLHPQRGVLPVSPVETALLARCDGVRSALDVATELSGQAGALFRDVADVYALIDQLTGRDILRWGLDLPMNLTAEPELHRQLGAIPDPAVRTAAISAFRRLTAARDALAEAT
ncbi:MAG TPA: lantibiotic dehydratase, partial [Pseudonocardiaceae bacterium]|nr:lantibiotic dehydratase [Pseudonocardiaceae bacterium]